MLILEVLGIPAPKGNKTAYRSGDRIVLVEGKSPAGRQRVASWREAVAAQARIVCADLPGIPFADGPLRVTFAFRLPRPKSKPKKHLHPTGRPDIDKLARLAGDELNGIVWRDDAQVCEMHLEKTYATGIPGATITVQKLEEAHAA